MYGVRESRPSWRDGLDLTQEPGKRTENGGWDAHLQIGDKRKDQNKENLWHVVSMKEHKTPLATSYNTEEGYATYIERCWRIWSIGSQPSDECIFESLKLEQQIRIGNRYAQQTCDAEDLGKPSLIDVQVPRNICCAYIRNEELALTWGPQKSSAGGKKPSLFKMFVALRRAHCSSLPQKSPNLMWLHFMGSSYMSSCMTVSDRELMGVVTRTRRRPCEL